MGFERRKQNRCLTDGIVLLFRRDSPLPFAGELRDVSGRGFRVRHTCLKLQPGNLVAFRNRNEQGVARLIWNCTEMGAIESGFLVMDVDQESRTGFSLAAAI